MEPQVSPDAFAQRLYETAAMHSGSLWWLAATGKTHKKRFKGRLRVVQGFLLATLRPTGTAQDLSLTILGRKLRLISSFCESGINQAVMHAQ